MHAPEESQPDTCCHPTPGFEGPEKKVEIEFRFLREGDTEGLRSISQDKIQEMLDDAKCTILNKTSNEFFDAYVLSESSLFIYPRKAIVKTCGTTTLLKCVPRLLAFAEELHMAVDIVYFSRKNLNFPTFQHFPHQTFEDEISYLQKFFPEGSGFVMGPVNKDRWHLFLADYLPENHTVDAADQTLEICMHDLDHDAMKVYFKAAHEDDTVSVATVSGIRDIIPGSVIDEFMFDPCGYSMNGLFGPYYWTIHITPEDHCSYVSFETNVPKSAVEYNPLIERVLSVFKPGRFTLSLFADNLSFDGTPTFKAIDFNLPGMTMKDKTFYDFEGDYNIVVANYAAKKTC